MGLLCSMLHARATDGQIDKAAYKKVIEQWIRVMTDASATGEAPSMMTSSPIRSYSATIPVSAGNSYRVMDAGISVISWAYHCVFKHFPFSLFFVSFPFHLTPIVLFPFLLPLPPPCPFLFCSSKPARITLLHKDSTSTVMRALKQTVVPAH